MRSSRAGSGTCPTGTFMQWGGGTRPLADRQDAKRESTMAIKSELETEEMKEEDNGPTRYSEDIGPPTALPDNHEVVDRGTEMSRDAVYRTNGRRCQ